MPRPRKRRRVGRMPAQTFYKPQGIPLSELKSVILPVEGFEALRLADASGLSQAEAAARMGVSRPTFSRVLAEARRTVARALASGWAITIQGGDYHIENRDKPPSQLPRGGGRGRRRRGQRNRS
ncbi:MAG: DUF134 domain-containing protein [Desulfobacterales bacterium]|nr:DUF134 domain-containing protein [Desulfobacterales bacterium]